MRFVFKGLISRAVTLHKDSCGRQVT